MNGGEITANQSPSRGGGVYLESDGIFIMNNGKISNNRSFSNGGGVFGGIFTMNGGEISGNQARDSSANGLVGGGVYVGRTFRIVTGSIFYNGGSFWTAGNNLYGTAEYGTFDGDIWNPNGTLSSTDDQIHVIDGILSQ